MSSVGGAKEKEMFLSGADKRCRRLVQALQSLLGLQPYQLLNSSSTQCESGEQRNSPFIKGGEGPSNHTKRQASGSKAEGSISFTVAGRITVSRESDANASFRMHCNYDP
jgi:hypothetical protein